MGYKKEISIIIPCYNEEKNIEKCIKELELFFFKMRKAYSYELIFVDDGSTDNTKRILNRFSRYNTRINTVSYKENKGKGYAVRMGLMKAKHNIRLILDCDLSVKPIELLYFNSKFNTNHKFLVIGNRYQTVSQPKYRLFAGWIYRTIVKIMFKMKYHDTQCPYKILVNIPNKIIKDLNIDGFSYDVELIYKIEKNKVIPIYEQRVIYQNDTDSKVTLIKTFKMFFELLRIRFMK